MRADQAPVADDLGLPVVDDVEALAVVALVYTLDRRHFVPAISGYRPSIREADTLVDDRLQTFKPAGGASG